MSIVRRLLGGILFASAALGIAAACGPGFLDGLTDGFADGGPPGSGGRSDAARAEVCELALPPAPPTSADAIGTEYWFAFEQIKIDTQPGDGGLAPPQGLDVDGLCTCHPNGRACIPPNGSATDPTVGDQQCDADGGRDDALGVLFNQLLAGIPQASTDFATRKIQQGFFTILVNLRGWNGLDDDPLVQVTLMGSQHIDAEDGGRPVPRFDGTDTWTIDPLSLYQGDLKVGADCRIDTSFCLAPNTRIADGQNATAYVKDGMLVAKFSRTPFIIGTNVGDLLYDGDDPVLVANISKDANGQPRLTGELVSKWPAARALPAISALTFPQTSDGGLVSLCLQKDLYPLVKDQVCLLNDLPPRDGGVTSRCDALSGSIAFSAATVPHPSFVFRRTDGGGPCSTFQDDCTQ